MKKIITYCFVAMLAMNCKKDVGTTSPTPIATPVPTPTLPYNYKNDYLFHANRFDSVVVFSNSKTDTINGIYGNNLDYKGVNTPLPFTFYAPKKSLDSMTKRPFILVLHGGGFLNGSYTSQQSLARQFALRGYAAATIEYRQGFNKGAIPCVNGDSIEVYKAVYRAVQDANAAMRYFVANANAMFGIDTSQLFVYGSSAGNVTTSAMLYCSNAQWNALVPNITTTLGDINTASNNLINSFNIQAELTHTGYGLQNKNAITMNNCKPVLYMQGSVDATLPPDYGPDFQCPLGTYGHSYGSNVAKEIVKGFKYPYEQWLDIGLAHDVSTHYTSTFTVNKCAAFIKRLWAANYRWVEYQTFTQTLNLEIK